MRIETPAGKRDYARRQKDFTDRAAPLAAKPGRYRPPDTLLAFLESL